MKDDFDSIPGVQLFYKTDSHWTPMGAFLGYRTLIRKIQQDFPEIESLTIHDFSVDSLSTSMSERDIVNMVQIKRKEMRIRLIPNFRSEMVETEKKLLVPTDRINKSITYERRFKCDGKPLKVLVFGDSFVTELIPFLARTFGETVIVRSGMDENVVQIEKPDIVISEKAERDLDDFVNR